MMLMWPPTFTLVVPGMGYTVNGCVLSPSLTTSSTFTSGQKWVSHHT
jgi:hypothetical protein